MRFHRPSPASVISILALVLALSGTALAAKHYIVTSTSQIKPSVLKKLKGHRGPAGAQGPAGPSVLSVLAIVNGPKTSVPPHEAGFSIATCPSGTHVVSGGGTAITGQGNGLAASEMSADHSSWFTIVGNTSTLTGEVQAIAYCSSNGQAVSSAIASATASSAHERARREAEALAAKVGASLSH